jgi:sodium-dependent dicarboxylate transporter 2/3/5
MIPMALAILSHVDNDKLKVALLLGIAYASSLGGIGTPIGTPPNVIFMAIYEETTGNEFSFLQWMKIGVPIVLVALPIMAFWLTRNVSLSHDIELPTLTEWRTEEKRTILIFGLTALAWITRTEPFGGWSDALGLDMVSDSTVALLAAVIMFMTPNGKNGHILDWKTAQSIPWGMLLLFAGGIVIAKGFAASGLSDLIGQWLTSLSALPVLLMMLSTCLFVTYLTEISSNTATATLLMPILAVAATASHIDPALLMIPAAMCASCAFMLPVATAPNAIAFSTGKLSIQTMVKEGFILSFIVSCLIAVCCYVLLQ